MSGLEVACDDEFTTDSTGALRVRGVRRGAAWPYSTGTPSAGNALGVDPELGLWAAARDPVVVDTVKTMSGGNAGIAAGKVYTYPYQQVSVKNPSSVQRSVILFTWFWSWCVNIAANAVADVQGSIIRLDARTTPNWQHLGSNHNQARGVSNPTWPWYGSRMDADTEYLEPGQTSIYRIQIRVLCGASGSLAAVSAQVGMRGLGTLL